MANLYLYKVTASETDYDCFSEAVVYAETPSHALQMVLDLTTGRTQPPAGTGAWYPLLHGAGMSARRVSIRPGPVMGYSRAG